MKNIKLVVNNFASESNIYFNKGELKTILNLYARMVSDGFWKDYDLDISKNTTMRYLIDILEIPKKIFYANHFVLVNFLNLFLFLPMQ